MKDTLSICELCCSVWSYDRSESGHRLRPAEYCRLVFLACGARRNKNIQASCIVDKKVALLCKNALYKWQQFVQYGRDGRITERKVDIHCHCFNHRETSRILSIGVSCLWRTSEREYTGIVD